MVFKSCPCIAMARGTDSIPGVGFGDHAPADESGGGKAVFERFTTALPDAKALAVCPEDELLKLWEGLGYYNRVRNMQKAAVEVVEYYGGQLPADYEKLLKLKGIGHYTAGAVASIAYGIPVPGRSMEMCSVF